ncbi:MAG: D-tyrosyl-tRNA(Tyr) deacylase [Spirochaetales bacterium]|nr:D-tyrosyl-tRNA(Tyr) deacylase [Spirochaetales bacterium]
MKVVLQRVKEARVVIEGKVKGEIKKGILIFLGIENADSDEDIAWLTGKISRLRIFPDQKGVMNLSVQDVDGEFLIVSQFTLHASIKKGNRPYYGKSADPEKARVLYSSFIREMELCLGKKAQTGDFGAQMEVSLINDGPVTILMDSKNIE